MVGNSGVVTVVISSSDLHNTGVHSHGTVLIENHILLGQDLAIVMEIGILSLILSIDFIDRYIISIEIFTVKYEKASVFNPSTII